MRRVEQCRFARFEEAKRDALLTLADTPTPRHPWLWLSRAIKSVVCSLILPQFVSPDRQCIAVESEFDGNNILAC